MKKKQAILKFRIGIDLFYNVIKKLISFMRRDQVEFTKYGITTAMVDAVEEQLETFSDIPTDSELEGAKLNATAFKDELAGQVRQAITEIMVRVENKFGKDSGHYRKFGANGLSHMDGGILDTCARRVIRVGNEYLTELEGQGLTSGIIDNLKTLNKNYSDALALQENAIANRDIASENRISIANAIYETMMKYSNTGKKIWQNVNEARYNDYVIYDTPTGNVDGDAEAPAA